MRAAAPYWLSLTGKHRTRSSNRQLGAILAFVAGAINAGGFLAIQRYTSSMTAVIADLGIELERLIGWNRTQTANEAHFVRANRDQIFIHALVLTVFFVGGLVGALAFKYLGFSAC